MPNDKAGFKPGEYTRKMIFQSMTQAARKKKSTTPNRSRSYDLLVTSPSVSIWLGIDMADGHQQKPDQCRFLGEVTTYSSPKPTFSPKWEVSDDNGLGEG